MGTNSIRRHGDSVQQQIRKLHWTDVVVFGQRLLRLRGSISRELQWDVMPDLFFYRDPEEAEKEEQQRQETLAQAAAAAQAQQAPKQDEDWGGEVTDWANEPQPGIGG